MTDTLIVTQGERGKSEGDVPDATPEWKHRGAFSESKPHMTRRAARYAQTFPDRKKRLRSGWCGRNGSDTEVEEVRTPRDILRRDGSNASVAFFTKSKRDGNELERGAEDCAAAEVMENESERLDGVPNGLAKHGLCSASFHCEEWCEIQRGRKKKKSKK